MALGFLDLFGPLRGGFAGGLPRSPRSVSASDLENETGKMLDNLAHGHLNFLGAWLSQGHHLLAGWHRSDWLPTVGSNFG